MRVKKKASKYVFWLCFWLSLLVTFIIITKAWLALLSDFASDKYFLRQVTKLVQQLALVSSEEQQVMSATEALPVLDDFADGGPEV